jgi:hypothetical protein
MTVVGKVESLWRYPVKSMRREEIAQSYLGFSGVYGDRLYAFHDKLSVTALFDGWPARLFDGLPASASRAL